MKSEQSEWLGVHLHSGSAAWVQAGRSEEENLTEVGDFKEEYNKARKEKIVENARKGEIIIMVEDSCLVKEGSGTIAKCCSGE